MLRRLSYWLTQNNLHLTRGRFPSAARFVIDPWTRGPDQVRGCIAEVGGGFITFMQSEFPQALLGSVTWEEECNPAGKVPGE